jgi:hypothetical protein
MVSGAGRRNPESFGVLDPGSCFRADTLRYRASLARDDDFHLLVKIVQLTEAGGI